MFAINPPPPLSVSKISTIVLFLHFVPKTSLPVYQFNCLHVVDPEAEPLKSGHVEERSPPPLPETDSLWYMSQSKVRYPSFLSTNDPHPDPLVTITNPDVYPDPYSDYSLFSEKC